jgi:hypothetical protein
MPSVAWFAPIYVAGCLVPKRRRAEWRRRWNTSLNHWRVLVERGELPVGTAPAFYRRAMADASHERFGVLRPYRFLAGPLFLIALSLAALILIGVFSHGFSATRHVIALANDMRLHPDRGYRYDLRGDRLFEYFAPIAIAASVGIALLFLKRPSLQSLGLRSWSLLLFEVCSLLLIGSLIWIEGGRRLFSYLANEGFRFGLLGVFLAAAFVLSFGFATLWSLADLRRRCPVCLHRLILPVALGSWASVFDPAATELVCAQGHGSLALMEVDAEAATPDRWTELDASWQSLFPKE